MLKSHIKNFKLFITNYTTDLVINIPALSMFILAITKFSPSSLESTLVVSASITTIFAIMTLTRRQYRYKLFIGSIYNFFTFITFFYVKTFSILTFFIIYEMFLLPSAALVWLFAPNERGYKTAVFFLAWTQLGSAMLLYSIYYIKTHMGIHHFLSPKIGFFLPPITIQILLLFGFLIKIPTFPFYFWLTKTHVEAVTSFSIFLSGFLVKIALFGIYKFLPFWSIKIKLGAFILAMTGAFITSVLFLYQLDVKKIVAYATVQEMSQLLAFFMIVQTTNIRTVSLFLLTHTIISAKFFYLADIFHRHNATRCTLAIAGTTITSPKLALVTVLGLVFFRGLPFTMKNAVEFSVLDALTVAETSFAFFWLFLIVFIGNVTFTYTFLKLLVFQPTYGLVTLFDLNKVEVLFFTTTTILLVFGPVIFFI